MERGQSSSTRPQVASLLAVPEDRPRPRRLLRALSVTTGALTLVIVALALVGAREVVAALTPLLFILLVPLGVVLGRRIWRRLTYRVSVRLLVSYLFIGCLPFPIMAILLALAGFMLVGQYASVRYGALEAQARTELEVLLGQTVAAGAASVTPAAPRTDRQRASLLDRGRVTAVVSTRSAVAVVLPGSLEQARTLPPLPPSWPDGDWNGPVLIDDSFYLAALHTAGGRTAAALLPLDVTTARLWAAEQWFDISFPTFKMLATAKGVSVTTGAHSRAQNDAAPTPRRDDLSWGLGRSSGPGFWHRRRVVWFRASQPPLDWRTGQLLKDRVAVALLRTSPAEAWADFTASPYRLQSELLLSLGVVAGALGVVYLLAVGMAGSQIVAIARAASRLTRGARAVSAGELSYRIPVKRRDQLGDLAMAYNAMAGAVERMLAEVGEKERLKREMELAREIQQSLLPDTQVDHGDMRVDAHFRPASEVGGDYFDIFRLPEGRLLVAVGDIAGHGLSTGLLMAMVKAAMTALVHEGYRGEELLDRLNRTLLQQPVRHRMVTLLVADLDTHRERLELTSCGHPPAFVLSPEGGCTEVELHSLPLGSRMPLEPARRAISFPSGSTLVLYTDGLVEAADATGTPFGYNGVKDALEALTSDPGTVVPSLLAAFDAHSAGAAAADDLTVVSVTLRSSPPSARD